MAITLEWLRADNLYLVTTFEATPEPDPWVREVEEIAYGPGAAEAILASKVIGWLIYDDATLIGMALQMPAGPNRYAELLHTLCINYPERGEHVGQKVLETVLARVLEESEFDYVVWLVHPHNAPMNTISQCIAPDVPQVDSRGNYLYAWP